jgi:Flp pilus assembly protein TadG
MTRFLRLLRDERGAGIIEFALILPALILFIYGTFIFGQLLEANAGMQHALGEGARYATLCLDPDASSGCTPVENSDIQDRISDNFFGSALGTFSTPTVTDGTGFKTLTVTYTMPMDFIFFSLPDVTLTQTKRVYTA